MDLRDELQRGDCFLLEIDDVSVAGFSACRGIGERQDVFEYREGGFSGVRRFRGARRGGRFLLERGLTQNRELWKWYEDADPRSGALVFLSSDRQRSTRLTFEGAWPVAWSAADLDASDPAIAIEKLEIVCEAVKWEAS